MKRLSSFFTPYCTIPKKAKDQSEKQKENQKEIIKESETPVKQSHKKPATYDHFLRSIWANG